ncbi:MAG: hypothetical protein M0C28_36585 [Candidatus Moduliflexus flocculans]|nr:hypothetical protein [Candidatus Moduliflexus flocculans]
MVKHESSLLIYCQSSNRQPSTIRTSGLYHYLREDEAREIAHPPAHRPGRHGTLIVNANSVMHLNPTAALMAYLMLEESGRTAGDQDHPANSISVSTGAGLE